MKVKLKAALDLGLLVDWAAHRLFRGTRQSLNLALLFTCWVALVTFITLSEL